LGKVIILRRETFIYLIPDAGAIKVDRGIPQQEIRFIYRVLALLLLSVCCKAEWTQNVLKIC
jgi:hypothetical protein